MGAEEAMREGKRAGYAGLILFGGLLVVVIVSGRCSPPDGPTPSPSPTVSAVRSR